jgi:tetratricopeptide (TPR) repeat protein
MSGYQNCTPLRERIDPSKLPGVTLRLASSLVNEGVIFWNTGKESRAEEKFRRAEELLQSIPSEQRSVGGSVDLLLGQVNVNWCGMLYLSGKLDEAITRADAGLIRLEQHLKIEPNDMTARNASLQLRGNRAYALTQLGKHRQSAGDWTRVVELSAQPVPAEYRVRLAVALLHAGEQAAAFTQAQFLKPGKAVDKGDCYDLGCIFARAAEAVRNDKQLSADQRAKLVESHISDALSWLVAASKAGFFRDAANRDQAQSDPDLTILRDNETFRQLVEPPQVKP